jgi:mannose-6-phosphate isomerase-like protein (cupin superfamily)
MHTQTAVPQELTTGITIGEQMDTKQLFHEDSRVRGRAALELMKLALNKKLPQSTFDKWKRAALDDKLSYEYTGIADCCKLTHIKVMGNFDNIEATYAISEVGAQSIPVARDVLDEEYFVIAGTGAVWIKTDEEEKVISVKQGSYVEIPKKAGTQFKNLGNEPLIFLVLTSPPYEVLAASGVKIERKLPAGHWG